MDSMRTGSEDSSLRVTDILQHRELQNILRAFAEKRVDVMLLKGAYLKNKVYKNPILRPMGDIDILVKMSQKQSAVSALTGMGYSDVNKSEFFAEDERGVLELVRNDVNFSHHLDLHTAIVNLPGLRSVMDLPSTLLWNECEKMFIEGIPCYGMKPELLLLYLCYHVALHHGFHGEMWYQDLKEVLTTREKQFSWDHFFELARACGMVRVVYFSLKESKLEKFCADKHETFAAAEKEISSYEKSLVRALTDGRKHVRHEDYFIAILLIDGARRKIVFLLSYMFSWFRAGAQNGAGGMFFAVKHIVSRFFRLGSVACRLLFSRKR